MQFEKEIINDAELDELFLKVHFGWSIVTSHIIAISKAINAPD